MKDKLIKMDKIFGLSVGVITLVLFVLNVISTNTAIIITIINVLVALIMGNIVIPIISQKQESKACEGNEK
jgi:uncharacterized protein YacL